MDTSACTQETIEAVQSALVVLVTADLFTAGCGAFIAVFAYHVFRDCWFLLVRWAEKRRDLRRLEQRFPTREG